MLIRGIVLLALVAGGLFGPPVGALPTAEAATAPASGAVVAAAQAKPRATIAAHRYRLASGRVRVAVASDAAKVKVVYRTSGKKRKATIRLSDGVGAKTLPKKARKIRARAAATEGLRASARIKVRLAPVPAGQPATTPPPAQPAPVQPAPVAPTHVGVGPGALCRVSDSRLTEISGIVASVRFPGVVWVNNDSGDSARIFAVDVSSCAVRAVVQLAGVSAVDFEAISMGRDASGAPEIWVGDVGDNGRVRSHVRLYRFAEPTSLVSQSVSVSPVTVTWSDGARDCESLMVEPVPGGRVFLVAKDSSGGIYQLRGDFRATGSATTGTRLSTTRSAASDAAISPDRTRTAIRFYNSATIFAGVPGTSPVTVSLPTQAQGEAITFSPDGRFLYIASEGTGSQIISVSTAGMPTT